VVVGRINHQRRDGIGFEIEQINLFAFRKPRIGITPCQHQPRPIRDQAANIIRRCINLSSNQGAGLISKSTMSGCV
jgi:hypothetical protein